jgi:hypothetical protein
MSDLQIFTCEQGSPEWFSARLGIPTASEFSTVMAKGEGKTRRAYLLKLAGEVITGECAESYSNGHMERGKAMEADARDLYEMLHEADLEQVGFIRHGQKGCSPDGLIGLPGAVEFKSKLPHLLIDLLLKDVFPPEHKAQTQGTLWVAQREWIDLAVYWPKLPLFVKRAYRDEPYIANLAAEVDRFNDDLAATVEQVSRYGTPVERAA